MCCVFLWSKGWLVDVVVFCVLTRIWKATCKSACVPLSKRARKGKPRSHAHGFEKYSSVYPPVCVHNPSHPPVKARIRSKHAPLARASVSLLCFVVWERHEGCGKTGLLLRPLSFPSMQHVLGQVTHPACAQMTTPFGAFGKKSTCNDNCPFFWCMGLIVANNVALDDWLHWLPEWLLLVAALLPRTSVSFSICIVLPYHRYGGQVVTYKYWKQ